MKYSAPSAHWFPKQCPDKRNQAPERNTPAEQEHLVAAGSQDRAQKITPQYWGCLKETWEPSRRAPRGQSWSHFCNKMKSYWIITQSSRK